MEEQKSELIDVKGILKSYLRKWYWFVISVVCCLIIGFMFIKTMRPQYEVKANIILTENDALSSVMSAGGLSGVSALLGGNASAEDEVEILTSHSVLKNVVRTLGLNIRHFNDGGLFMTTLIYPEFPIDVVPAPEIAMDTLRTSLTFFVNVEKSGNANIKVDAKNQTIYKVSNVNLPTVVELPYGNFTVEPTEYFIKGHKYDNKITVSNYDNAAEDLREELNIALVTKRSQIISMQMVTDNTVYASDVLNTLIEKYNERGLQDHLTKTAVTADFLKDRLVMMRQELDSTETSLAKYKTNEGITQLEKDGEVIYKRMIDAEQALAEQQVETQLAKVTLNLVKKSATDNSLIPQQTTDPLLASQIEAYNSAVLSKLRMEQSAKADNPSMIRVDEQIKTLRANLIATLETAVNRSEQMTAEYRRVFNEASKSVNTLPTQELGYRAKMRDQTIQEEIYLFLLQKQEEVAIMMSNTMPKGAIVDEAYSLNEDKSASKKMILVFFFIVGLGVPPLFIALKNLISKVKK